MQITSAHWFLALALHNTACIFVDQFTRSEIKKMKQKIVMKVYMNCQKCRTKALKVVAETNGVNFVGLEGEDKENVVVIGDGVDAVKLAKCLRKKVGQTDILSVAAV